MALATVMLVAAIISFSARASSVAWIFLGLMGLCSLTVCAMAQLNMWRNRRRRKASPRQRQQAASESAERETPR